MKTGFLIEITVGYDLYLENAYNAKVERFKPLVDCLTENGYDVEMKVLCFNLLGSFRNDARKCLRRQDLYERGFEMVSLSNIIGSNSNYIWRQRTKKLLV